MTCTPALAGLVERFGWQRVYDVSLSVLGYPPSWMPHTADVLKLQDELEKGA